MEVPAENSITLGLFGNGGNGGSEAAGSTVTDIGINNGAFIQSSAFAIGGLGGYGSGAGRTGGNGGVATINATSGTFHTGGTVTAVQGGGSGGFGYFGANGGNGADSNVTNIVSGFGASDLAIRQYANGGAGGGSEGGNVGTAGNASSMLVATNPAAGFFSGISSAIGGNGTAPKAMAQATPETGAAQGSDRSI